MPPRLHRIRHFLSGFSVLISLLLAPAAGAVVLGEIRSSSRLGELLHAEIDVEEEPADRFDASCVKLYRPRQANADLPWLSEARLSFRRENGKGKLYISSDQPLRDPVLQIGVQSSCAGGRVWRDYTFLASPSAVASRELAVALQSPPTQAATAPVVLPKKRDRLAPAAQRAAETRPALRLTSWNAAHSASRTAVGSGDAVIFESALFLRMSSELPSTDSPSEFARDLLRLEYRLLADLHEQAGEQLAIAETLRRLERSAGELMAAGLRLDGAGAAWPASAAVAAAAGEKPATVAVAPVATVAPAVEPPLARTAAPAAVPPPAAQTANAPGDAFYYVGLGAALLTLLLFAIRRRRAAAPDEHLLPMHAPTIVVERPEFSPPPGQSLAVQVEDAAAISVPPAPPAATSEIPLPPENLGVTPVMELAEIMLSFGRVNGAAQTLQEFIEANPKVAVQPWIRLLEIYRDSGMRADFEALATNLHQNFNVEVVHWDDAVPGERIEMSLELLPHIRDQIDALWGKPECFDYLQKLLRDNRDGERTGFTLPVVKEILLLIDLMVAEKAAANK